MLLDRPWSALEKRLQQLAQGARDWSPLTRTDDDDLLALGLVGGDGQLTGQGQALYMARFVLHDSEAAAEALWDLLTKNEVVTAFCGAIWAAGEVPKAGAINLLKQITHEVDVTSATRWLEVMNSARIISYNRNKPKIRVLFNPGELVPPEEAAERERTRGHVISDDTPYSNLLALRGLLRSASDFVCWYEQHLPPKVLEVLVKEIDGERVFDIRLLSGPANLDDTSKSDFTRFQTEMKTKRGVIAHWRVLSKKEARRHHDRIFLSDGMARNLPPLNSIFQGSTGEILESEITLDDFEKWWDEGTELKDVQFPP